MRLYQKRVFYDQLGGQVDTPLIVPSVSSKGFEFIKDDQSGKTVSECADAYQAFASNLTSSLVSGYDLHHEYISLKKEFFSDRQVLFIDSGGYELSQGDWDSSEISIPASYQPMPFTLNNYNEVLSSLEKLSLSCPIVMASYDSDARGRPIQEQLEKAYELFSNYSNFVSNILIKPSGANRYIDESVFTPEICKSLRKFDILGITEKELGSNLRERLLKVARIRMRLERESVSTPIHVYGGLDPILTPLYFLAGADIFDGLSWLRFGYIDGLASYRYSYSFLKSGLTGGANDFWQMLIDNANTLTKLNSGMKALAQGGKFLNFPFRGKQYLEAYNVIATELELEMVEA